jgi:toxin ParE1/3/4
MARSVVWSHEATNDLQAIAEYIAKDSAFYAAAFVREIRNASRSLTDFSERGRIVPELHNDKIRELIVRDYRMVYSISETRVVILGLIHGKRDLKRLWGEEQRKS